MNTAITSPPPEAAKALQIADSAYEIAQALDIDGPEMFQAAGEELRSIKKRKDDIEAMRFSLTRPIDEAKKRIMDFFRPPTERLEQAEQLLRNGMLTFQRKEREKQEAARREAERKAREEREAAERARQEAEAAERKAREQAEAARAAGDAEAAAKAEAEVAAAVEIAEEAAAAVEIADLAPPTALATVEVPKAAGISSREVWKAEVTDFPALVKAAAAGLANGDTTLMGYLQPDTKALGQVAKALKAKACIPGIRIYADDAISVRTAA